MRFREGMASNEAVSIQAECVDLGCCTLFLDAWTKDLTVKLLEVTHSQWLYHNMQVYNTVDDSKAAQKKKWLQRLIEDQNQTIGDEGLDEQDR